MSNIEQYLQSIRTAILARTVRDDIANAIEQCYDDVHNPTLNTEAIQAAVQAKIDAGEMAGLTIGDGTLTGAKFADGTIPKAKLDPSITFDADAALDTTSTNAIQNKVVTDAISTLQADLGAQTVELSPTDNAPYSGYWVVTQQGKVVLVSNDGYYTLEHPIDISDIQVGGKAHIKSSIASTIGVYIFDENNNCLDYINSTNAESRGYVVQSTPQEIEIDIPQNAKYIVSSIRTTKYSGMSDFNVRCTTTALVDLGTRMSSAESALTEMADGAGKQEYEITPNFTDGYYVFINNTLNESSTYSYTDYIDVKPYKTITISFAFVGSGASMVFLSEDRQTVIQAYRRADFDSTTDVVINVPEGAAWFRSTQQTSKKNEFKFVGTMYYIETILNIASASVPTQEQPLDNIVHDGGFCRIFDVIGVVGDSLASGSIARPDSESHEESSEEIVDLMWYSWIQQMARYSGVTAYNFSMGGLSAHGIRFGTSNPNVQAILANLESNDKKCKAYFVALGHNDRNYANTHPEYVIGTIADCNLVDSSQNADSYYGNIAWVISKIKSVQPRAKIFLVTMKSASTFGDYNVAVRDMVGLFNTYYGNTDVYLVDMEGVPIETSWEYYNGHGSPQGYLNYSYQLSSYVDWIIRHNQNDFKTVPYIGTQYLT